MKRSGTRGAVLIVLSIASSRSWGEDSGSVSAEEAARAANKWSYDLLCYEDLDIWEAVKLATLIDPALHRTFVQLDAGSPDFDTFLARLNTFAWEDTRQLQHSPVFADEPGRMSWGRVGLFRPVYGGVLGEGCVALEGFRLSDADIPEPNASSGTHGSATDTIEATLSPYISLRTYPKSLDDVDPRDQHALKARLFGADGRVDQRIATLIRYAYQDIDVPSWEPYYLPDRALLAYTLASLAGLPTSAPGTATPIGTDDHREAEM